jgi:hypothetical protein
MASTKASRARWKRHERDSARNHGTERKPCDGREHSDFETGPFTFEHKLRDKLPKWILDGMGQAVTQAALTDKTPVLEIAFCEGRGHKTRRFIVMREEDWIAWHGKQEALDNAL